MNKQKTLIFSLSAILFLALSFIVYSWSEPTTMPSSYNPPINTSSTAQTKTGEIGASLFRDADNSNYYINPSGNSIIAGKIVTDNPISAGDLPNTIATKGYVDGLFGGNEQEVSLSNLIYVNGTNPSCPDGTIKIMESWVRKASPCQGTDPACGGYYTCTPSRSWQRPGDPAPSCTYYEGSYGRCTSIAKTCYADTIIEAICAKVDNTLFGQRHTESQCNALGGTMVIVEDNVRICKFPVTTQCFKQRSCNSGTCSSGSGCGSYTREAVYECPSGWTKYKKFVTTKSKTWSSSDFIYLCRDCSDSRPDCNKYCYGSTCTANPTNERVFSDKSNNVDACSIYCDTAYSCGNGNYFGQAEVIEAGCY